MGEIGIEEWKQWLSIDAKKYLGALADQYDCEWIEDKKSELAPKPSVIAEINQMTEEIKNKGFELEEIYNGVDAVVYYVNINITDLPETDEFTKLHIGTVSFDKKNSSKHKFVTSTDLQIVFVSSVSKNTLDNISYNVDTDFTANKDTFQKYLEQLDYIKLLYKQSKIKIKKFSATLDFV